MPRGTEAKQFQITCAVAVKMAAMAEMAVKAEKAEKAMSDDLRQFRKFCGDLFPEGYRNP